MSHFLLLCLGWALIVCTVPGNIELALLTIGGILPATRRRPTSNARPLITKLAVVVPAHNEAASIGRCVKSLAGCVAPGRPIRVDIVVIADNCDDLTSARARRAGARVIVRDDPKRRGKGYALQDAFERLLLEGYNGFVVVDADSIADTNLISELVGLIDEGADGAQARYCVLNVD